MIEFLLSDIGHTILLALLSTTLISPIIILGIYNNITHKYETSSVALFITATSTILLAILVVFIAWSIKLDYVSNETWKQIYANDIDANVKININNYDLILKGKDEITAGKNIDKIQYKALKSNNDIHVVVEKNGASYSKKVLIDQNDIISESEVNSNSKIVKIEYKNIQGHQRTLFGHKGPIEKDIRDNLDGKLRITLEQNSSEKELKQMFENKE